MPAAWKFCRPLPTEVVVGGLVVREEVRVERQIFARPVDPLVPTWRDATGAGEGDQHECQRSADADVGQGHRARRVQRAHLPWARINASGRRADRVRWRAARGSPRASRSGARWGTAGKELLFGHDESGKQFVYRVRLYLVDRRLTVVEAGGTKEQMDRYAASVAWMLSSVRVT